MAAEENDGSFIDLSFTCKEIQFQAASPGARANHVAIVLKSNLLVFGGLDTHQRNQNVYLFELSCNFFIFPLFLSLKLSLR